LGDASVQQRVAPLRKGGGESQKEMQENAKILKLFGPILCGKYDGCSAFKDASIQ